MDGKICCVTGHREIPAGQISYVKNALRHEIENAIADGYAGFLSGFANGVDQYFAEIVVELQRDNPVLQLVAVLPYRKRLDRLQARDETKALLDACTEVKVMQDQYQANVYFRRNRYMVERADRVIAVYDERAKGGTVNTIHFAHVRKKELRQIPVGPGIMVPED